MHLTPQSRLRDVMIDVLHQMGGRGSRADVLQRMAMVLNDEFTADDLESPKSRPFETKWRNRASYERAAMVRDGILQDRSDGVWALVDGR